MGKYILLLGCMENGNIPTEARINNRCVLLKYL